MYNSGCFLGETVASVTVELVGSCLIFKNHIGEMNIICLETVNKLKTNLCILEPIFSS